MSRIDRQTVARVQALSFAGLLAGSGRAGIERANDHARQIEEAVALTRAEDRARSHCA